MSDHLYTREIDQLREKNEGLAKENAELRGQVEKARADTALVNWIEEEAVTLDPTSLSTGAGDYECGWIASTNDKERISDSLRKAVNELREALARAGEGK